jgi:hypothetical protein
MTNHPNWTRWLWSIPICVIALIVGQMLGAGLAAALHMEQPQALMSNDASHALLLIPSSLAISVALAILAAGLSGNRWQRTTILAVFLYGVNGLGTMIETTIFTTLGATGALTVTPLPQAVLGGLTAAMLFPAISTNDLGARWKAFLTRWTPTSLAARLGVAVLAFPIIYLVFGAIVGPIVTPYYRQLDFLVLPTMPAIIGIAFTRSVLFLLVSLPMIVMWRLTRGRLILALGIGHFVAVGLSGLIVATFFPPALRWAHGFEIFADSMCYGAALGWLLFRRTQRATVERPEQQIA